MAPDDYHLAQIIKFTGEEFPPELVKTYELAPQFLDMQTGESVLYICCDEYARLLTD